MPAHNRVSCPKCGRRFGFFGELKECPPCPGCKHQIPLDSWEHDEKIMREAEQSLIDRKRNKDGV